MNIWYICLLLFVLIKNGDSNVINRVTGSLLEYSFDRLDCLHNNYLDITRGSNIYTGSILPINGSTSCSSYNALSIKGSSSKNITTILSQIKSVPITFEFWVGIDINNLINDNIVEILSIGKIDGSSYSMKV